MLWKAAQALWTSPVGVKTVHFWGPVFNWGFVLAALSDMGKSPDMISGKMTAVLAVYSMLFMRFSYMVQPRNYLLLSCHFCNECAQLYQGFRKFRYDMSLKDQPQGAIQDLQEEDRAMLAAEVAESAQAADASK